LKQKLQPKIEPFQNIPVRATIQKNRKDLVLSHWHPYYECIKVNRGEIIVEAGDISINLSKNDILFLQPGILHSAKANSMDSELLRIVFAELFPLQNEATAVDRFITAQWQPAYWIIRAEEKLANRICSIMEEIYICINSQNPFRHLSVLSGINQLSALLIEHKQIKNLFIFNSKSIAVVNQIIHYIEEHYSDNLTLEQLSSHVNLSKYHFARLFREATGVPPLTYVTKVRIRNSLQMLADDRLTIAEISDKTGFCNQHYFNRIFKKEVSYTPYQYRKQIYKI